MKPIVRVVAAGPGAAVRVVLSDIADLEGLRSACVAGGAEVVTGGARLHVVAPEEVLAEAARRSLPAGDADLLVDAVGGALRAWRGATPPLAFPGGQLDGSLRPLVMGVVNVTPDSFSDGGLIYPRGHPHAAIGHARSLLTEGADIIDVGGESARPGSYGIAAEEELRRVLPVIEVLAREGAVCSIDTVKPEVAAAAVRAGARIVNDVSGARDPSLLGVVADTGAGYVLMHTRGSPADMQSRTTYDDVVAEVYEFLARGLTACAAVGVPPDRVAVDPGIGFAKTTEQNLQLLQATRQFSGLGRPVLIGASRKGFIGKLLGDAPPSERVEGSVAAAVLAIADGASIVRVHDVQATVRAVTVAHAITRAALGDPDAH